MGADVDQEGAVSNSSFSGGRVWVPAPACPVLFYNTNTKEYMKQDEMLMLKYIPGICKLLVRVISSSLCLLIKILRN